MNDNPWRNKARAKTWRTRPSQGFFLSAAILVLSGFAANCLALEPSTPLASYGRQAWVMENGLPQNTVQALAQGKDGFIWLGTELGLVRFDGFSFQTFDHTSSPALPGNDVQCLLAAPDGALWIGTTDGLALLKNGKITVFSTKQGLPGNDIRRLTQENNGTVQVLTADGPAEIGSGGSVLQAGAPSSEIAADFNLQVFSRGLEAVADKAAVAVQRPGKPDVRLVIGQELPGSRIQALFADREGSLWIGTNAGLTRWLDGKLERLPVTDPLANASILVLTEDTEGNLWAGTEEGGLHILRDQRFRTVSARRGLSSDNTTAVVEDARGTLWVGTAGGGLNALLHQESNPESVHVYTVREGLPSDVILSLASSPEGDVWVGTPDGLGRIRDGHVSSFTSADGLPDDFIRSLLVDADGSLWIGTRHGLTQWSEPGRNTHAGSMRTFTQANGLGSDLVGALVRDRAGDLWVATFAGLSRIHNGSITNYTVANGLSSDVITALAARPDGTLLVGTQDHGWNLWNGGHFSHVDQPGPDGARQDSSRPDHISIHAILDDRIGHLWFATGSGIARCDCAGEMQRMQTAECSHWLDFGTADGLVSRETATNSHPSAWRASDGRLWFATPKGLEEADPAHFPVNRVPPPVAIERFAVDDVTQPLTGSDPATAVPAGRNHFQFEYAGLSFVAPQKVRYRFMLEGFDHNWTEAGTRRTAYYTNIPPGHYTFRVQAANNDGLWNTVGATLRFELRPHFYQTFWFYALLALGLAGLVLLALRLRLLRAEREFRAVLGERSRIAREIHDTLAQGYVGISVQLEVLSELLRHNKVEAAAKHLDTTRGYVREGLDDARQSIWSLRSQDATETTLPVRVRRLVEQAEGHGLEARFSLYGAYRPMPPGTEQEILRVAQEAIHNVKKHAAARNLAVQLEYGSTEIALEIRDNGRGFPNNPGSRNGPANESQSATSPEAGSVPDSPPGHYGLTGMKERAAAINGVLELTSVPGEGTTVRLRAPAGKKMKEPGE